MFSLVWLEVYWSIGDLECVLDSRAHIIIRPGVRGNNVIILSKFCPSISKTPTLLLSTQAYINGY